MRLLVLAAAAWRLSSLLIEEEGPGLIFVKLRDAAGIYYDEFSQRQADNEVGKALLCFWCLSVWIGWLFALIEITARGQHRKLWRVFTNGLALSAGVILWEKYSGASK